MPTSPTVLRLTLALAPLALTLLFAWLTMEGYFSFSSGEKDILIAVPLLIWSLVYLCSSLVLWSRRAAIGRSVATASTFATAIVAVAWLVLFMLSSVK